MGSYRLVSWVRGLVLVAGLVVLIGATSAWASPTVPLSLVDPFPNQSRNMVGQVMGQITVPNGVNGGTELEDIQLPLTGPVQFRYDIGASYTQSIIDPVNGYADAVLNKAAGRSYTYFYTQDLPLAGVVEGLGVFHSYAGFTVYGPSADGVSSHLNPDGLGTFLLDCSALDYTHSAFSWEVKKWTWDSPDALFPTVTVLGSGTDAFDFSALPVYVTQIAAGRPIGYYQVQTMANSSSYDDSNWAHARFDYTPEPATLALLGLGLPLLLKRRRRK
jgi:hypothetical protein